MSFSYEDKSAWFSSEVMREFEKIAMDEDILNGSPEEAFLPIDLNGENVEEPVDEETWEEEGDLETAIGDAAGELTGTPSGESVEDEKILDDILKESNLKVEMASLYMNNLLSNLQDMAYDFGGTGHNKAALAIERTINMIKAGGMK